MIEREQIQWLIIVIIIIPNKFYIIYIIQMTTLAKGSNNTLKKDLLEPNSYLARCYSFIDLWTHQNPNYKNKDWSPIEQRKVRLTFELPTEMKVFDEEKWEQPVVLWKKYTNSLSEKAYLRKDLESWRGKQFTEQELKWFDLSNIVWTPCILSVWINEYDWKEYNQINSINPLMKWQDVDKQINPKVIFDLDKYTIEEFNELPNFIKREISNSVEWAYSEYEEDENKKLTMIKKIDPLKKEEEKEISNNDDLPF